MFVYQAIKEFEFEFVICLLFQIVAEGSVDEIFAKVSAYLDKKKWIPCLWNTWWHIISSETLYHAGTFSHDTCGLFHYCRRYYFLTMFIKSIAAPKKKIVNGVDRQFYLQLCSVWFVKPVRKLFNFSFMLHIGIICVKDVFYIGETIPGVVWQLNKDFEFRSSRNHQLMLRWMVPVMMP